MKINNDIILNQVYPIGSIYMSVSSTSPATLFGGTWERIEGCFLLGANSTYTAGSTGGEAAHTLTSEELPNMVTVRDNCTNASGNSNWAQMSGWGNYQNNTRGKQVNKPHNNMPPYLAVYIWERTA